MGRDNSDALLGGVLLAVCVLYAVGLCTGWYLTSRGRLDLSRIMQSRRALTDPLTRRFQRWCQTRKMEAVRRQQWTRLRLLIFANNLVAVALVGRTLYGIALAPAVYLTFRQGLTHGTLAAQLSTRPTGALLPVAVLEFGGYLLATALGVNLAAAPVAGGTFSEALSLLLVFYPVVGALLLSGAWLEVNALRANVPAGFQLSEGVDVEQLRAKALEMMKRSSGGAG